MIRRVAYWFIFWVIWLNWYLLLSLLAVGAALSATEWLDLIKLLLFTGGLGCIGGVLYQSLNSQPSQKRHCCGSTIFWGLFWMSVYLLTFSIISSNCDPTPVSNHCGYSLFAMILLSPIVIIYTVMGGILGEAIRRKLQRYFAQRN